MEENELKNIVYKATCPHFEWLESKHLYSGNGHHLAQKVCNLVWDNYKKERQYLEENREIEKIANKLYKLNAGISLFFVTGAVKPDKQFMESINVTIGNIIKELRECQKK